MPGQIFLVFVIEKMVFDQKKILGRAEDYFLFSFITLISLCAL